MLSGYSVRQSPRFFYHTCESRAQNLLQLSIYGACWYAFRDAYRVISIVPGVSWALQRVKTHEDLGTHFLWYRVRFDFDVNPFHHKTGKCSPGVNMFPGVHFLCWTRFDLVEKSAPHSSHSNRLRSGCSMCGDFWNKCTSSSK